MPVIVNAAEPHPFLPSLGDPTAIAAERALHQDIRPLEIAIINLMADKQATERQLGRWLGHTPLQIRLTFAATDAYVDGVRAGRETRNTSADHIRKFYSAFSDIREHKFDGLIVTGINALKPTVAEEDFWPDVEAILAWSETNVFSSLFLCWGAKAALRHFHGIESYRGERKIWGVFRHRLVSDRTGILFGFPDVFPAPVSRWKNPRREDITRSPALEIVADCDEIGPSILVESNSYDDGRALYPRRVYLLSHPEYETGTLRQEYLRDAAAGVTITPLNYFPDDDPAREPVNNWRHTAMIYGNWINAIYKAGPFDIRQIPAPSRYDFY
ncbi:MAG: homoserine O-succinyltransferase [Rhodopila sp.]